MHYTDSCREFPERRYRSYSIKYPGKTYFLYAVLILSIAVSLPAAAEKVTAYRDMSSYTVEDGLLSNSIYGIVQDSLGFIWFGTDNGLCRFDGNEFMSYTHDEMRPSGSISSNNIRRLMLDSRGDPAVLIS